MVLVALFFALPLAALTLAGMLVYGTLLAVRGIREWGAEELEPPSAPETEAVAELRIPGGGRQLRSSAGRHATNAFVEEGMTRQKDISDRLERVPAFEERARVRLEALFAEMEDEFLSVNGELHAREGDQLSANIELVVTAHDAQGRVLKMETASFNRESFFQFEPFSVVLDGLPSPPARIRIYPKLLSGSEE